MIRTGNILILLSLILTGCALTQKDKPDGTLYGHWQGTLPCADCSGIETRLTLFRNPDHYQLKEIYLGKSDDQNTFTRNGDWRLVQQEAGVGQGIIMLSPADGKTQRQLARQPSGALTFLNNQGEPIASDLNYTLQRRPGDTDFESPE